MHSNTNVSYRFYLLDLDDLRGVLVLVLVLACDFVLEGVLLLPLLILLLVLFFLLLLRLAARDFFVLKYPMVAS